MKKILAMLLVIGSLSASAQNLRPLKDRMEDMGTSFKTIGASLMIGSINAKVVTESDKLINLTRESAQITPDTILSLPRVEQARAKATYDKEMKELEAALIELNTAVKSNNLDAAKKALAKVNDIKKQGHKDFK